MPKADNTTKQRRLEALKLLNEGKPYGDIAKTLSDKYKVSERQGYRYVESATRLMSKIVEQQLSNVFCELSSKFLYLYELAMEKRDYELALNVIKHYVKSFGLHIYTPIPTNSGAVGNMIDELVIRVDRDDSDDE